MWEVLALSVWSLHAQAAPFWLWPRLAVCWLEPAALPAVLALATHQLAASPARHFHPKDARFLLAALALLAHVVADAAAGSAGGALELSAILAATYRGMVYLLAFMVWFEAHGRRLPPAALRAVGALVSALVLWVTVRDFDPRDPRFGPALVKTVHFALEFLATYWRTISYMALTGGLGAAFGFARMLVTDKAPKRRVVLGRKYFHLLALLIALPWLWNPDVCVVGWAFFVYFYLIEEVLRQTDVCCNIKKRMERVTQLFTDDRDRESLIVTPLFLALGCFLPAALVHALPPREPKVQSTLVFAGVLATCVGDSMSALVPTWLIATPHRIWKKKSYEGLLSFILSHHWSMVLVVQLTGAKVSHAKLLAIAAASGVAETITTRVDNYWVSVVAVTVGLLLLSGQPG